MVDVIAEVWHKIWDVKKELGYSDFFLMTKMVLNFQYIYLSIISDTSCYHRLVLLVAVVALVAAVVVVVVEIYLTFSL